jgi:hypothetical protein
MDLKGRRARRKASKLLEKLKGLHIVWEDKDPLDYENNEEFHYLAPYCSHGNKRNPLKLFNLFAREEGYKIEFNWQLDLIIICKKDDEYFEGPTGTIKTDEKMLWTEIGEVAEETIERLFMMTDTDIPYIDRVRFDARII